MTDRIVQWATRFLDRLHEDFNELPDDEVYNRLGVAIAALKGDYDPDQIPFETPLLPGLPGERAQAPEEVRRAAAEALLNREAWEDDK